jgi:uncharacterized membrane protein YphA (DoxX/SURF4 family)
MAVGITAISAGVVYFSGSSSPSLGKWSLGIVLITSGAAMTIGFLTPFSGLLVGVTFLGIALSWFPVPPWSLLDVRPLAWGMIITAASIALLGPGIFSLDGRLFGRREIVIPPASRGSES